MPGPRQNRERCANSCQHDLHPDQQPPPVEDVGEDSADQAEQHVRKIVGHLHERNEDCRLSPMHQEPLGTDRLHPEPDVADQDSEPEGPESTVAKRHPGRTVSRAHPPI